MTLITNPDDFPKPHPPEFAPLTDCECDACLNARIVRDEELLRDMGIGDSAMETL